MRIIDCYSETSDIGPDIAVFETEDSGFTLLMSRSGDPYDHMKVYFDDEEASAIFTSIKNAIEKSI